MEKCVLGYPVSRATSYFLLPDSFQLRASKNAFKVGSVKFSHCLPLSDCEVMPGKSQGS